MTAHNCPVNGCPQHVSSRMLMCRYHWYAVPRPLRNAVWAAWRGGEGVGTPEHTVAIRAAIDAVNQQVTS
jgi:hypothetical protein